MLVRKAYKFRIYPNKAQQAALVVQFGYSRFVYNHFLALRIESYEKTGKGLSYAETTKTLTALKFDPEHEWLKDADSQALQQTLKDLDRAYQNFFEKRAGFPRFKSRRAKQAYRYPQRVKADPERRRMYLPKERWVKTVFHRPLEGKIKNVTVSRTKSGRYHVSFQVEMDIEAPQYQGGVVVLDLGLLHYVALSDGTTIPNPRNLIHRGKKLAHLQRRLSRCKEGSGGRDKARLQVSRMQERIANQRKDFQHKLTRWLVEEYGLIGLESLNVKGMLGNGHLAKHIGDAAWGEFCRQLAYKGDRYGCQIQQIDPWYPSSKRCSACGAVMEGMALPVRQWAFPECQAQHDRDVNAARNILMQVILGTTGSHAGGVDVRPVYQGQAGTLKPEAHHLSGG